MKKILVITLLLLCAALFAQETMPFGGIRHSSVCADGNLRLRWNDLSGGMYPQECWYRINNGGWQSAPVDNSDLLFNQALLPYQFGQTLRYRLKADASYMNESIAYMHPAYLGSDTFPPVLNTMALIGTDATGDSITVYAPALDLTDSYIAATANKFYSTLANVANSFPTMLSLTSYNVYLTTIMNPVALADSVAYAMIYSFNIAGVISPGLYKVGMDATGIPTFARIGNIQSQVSGGKLYMACNISDLTNDPNFGPWPNESNALMFSSATMRININSVTLQPEFGFGDSGSYGVNEFLDLRYNVPQNTLPALSQPGFANNIVSVTYTDINGDFPLMAEFVTHANQTIPMTHLSNDFSQPVTFTGLLPVGTTGGTFRFSDNESDVVELAFQIVSIEDDYCVPAPISVSMPNPFKAGEISIKGLGSEMVKAELFNLRGQKLGVIHQANPVSGEVSFTWDGKVKGSNPGSGIYFIKITSGKAYKWQRFVIIQ
ncbi:MAG: T9SS type A sorting domain-containing protein [Candidatus Cloacimonadaceae bacterium]|nr:T9SS type A sorting domain-containing protein [Candidatus Cloacimonadaceae bacterium]